MIKTVIKKALPLLLGLACLGLFMLLPAKANAANPTTMSFQGKVVNSDGTNVADGTHSFIFRIYNTSSPTMTTTCTSTSSCLWQETQASVQVTSGVFQVELGSSCALTSGSCNNSAGGPINFANNNSLYLTMQFDGDTSGSNGGYMSPLIHITSVPFALQADNSSTLGGISSSGFIQNQTASLQAANFRIQSAASGSIAAAITGASGQSVDILDVDTNGNANPVLGINSTGNATFRAASSSTTAFQIQNSSGNDNLFLANTINNNLVTNSSAETNANGWAINTSTGSVTSDTSQALYGNASLNITTTGSTANQGAKFSNVLSASTNYAFSFWAKIASGSFTVQAGRADNNTFAGETTCTLNISTVTTVWQRFTCNFQTSGSVTSGGYVFIRASDSTNRTWYVDGIQLESATSTTAPTVYHEGSLQFNGTITSPTTFQNQADSNAAFQIQDAAGAPLFLVDTTSTDNTGATVNYVKYSGFESGSFGDATAGWNKVASATLSQNSNKKHSFNGLYSAQLATTASGDGMTTSSFTSAPPTGTYIVSFYVKTSSGSFNGNNFQITATPGTGGANICSPSSSLTINPSGFQRLYCSVTTNGAMTALQIVQNTSGTNTFYIDGVQAQSNTYNGNSISAPTSYQLGEIQLRGIITSPLIVATNGDSISAFQVQNTSGSSVITADTLNGQTLLGNAGSLNGVLVFNNSGTGGHTISLGVSSTDPGSNLIFQLPNAVPGASNYCVVSSNLGILSFLPCGAGSTATVTLAAEYAGAVMTGDGANNTGTMTSDFCSGSSHLGIPASSNPCSSTQEMNYYSWTANATNDYDIWVRWQAPSDIKSSGSFGTVNMFGWTSSASDSVQLTFYNSSGTSCGSATVSAASSSFTSSSFTPSSSCDVSGGQYITARVHLNVAVNGEFARAGDIVINYNRQ